MTKDRGENKPDIYGMPTYDDWANSTEYKQFDRVNYYGAVYAARKANSGVNPFFDDGETWEHISGVAFVNNDTMDVENVNGTMVSGRKVNASGGVGSNVTSHGLNIYGMKASKDSYGVVKIGDGISIDDGVISADSAEPYTLPIAKNNVLGGVKIGSGVNVADDGTISVAEQEVSYTTKSNAGIIQLGNGLKVENASGLTSIDYGTGLDMVNGKVSGKVATTDSVGVVKPDGDTITVDEDGTLVATPTLPTNVWSDIEGVTLENQRGLKYFAKTNGYLWWFRIYSDLSVDTSISSSYPLMFVNIPDNKFFKKSNNISHKFTITSNHYYSNNTQPTSFEVDIESDNKANSITYGKNSTYNFVSGCSFDIIIPYLEV